MIRILSFNLHNLFESCILHLSNHILALLIVSQAILLSHYHQLWHLHLINIDLHLILQIYYAQIRFNAHSRLDKEVIAIGSQGLKFLRKYVVHFTINLALFKSHCLLRLQSRLSKVRHLVSKAKERINVNDTLIVAGPFLSHEHGVQRPYTVAYEELGRIGVIPAQF